MRNMKIWEDFKPEAFSVTINPVQCLNDDVVFIQILLKM